MSRDFKREITSLITEQPGRIGLLIKIDGTVVMGYHENDQFRSASLIKLAVLNHVLDQRLDLHEPIQIDPAFAVGGAGVLQLLDQRIWSLQDLLALMISDSDNFASNCVIHRVGLDAVNQSLEKWQFTKTHLNRYLMDKAAAEAGKDNFTSPAESLRLLEKALGHGLKIANWFMNQQFRYKLPASFDESGNGITVYNKTGEGYQIDHDVAKFVYDNHSIEVAMLTFGFQNRLTVIHLFNRVGVVCAKQLVDL